MKKVLFLFGIVLLSLDSSAFAQVGRGGLSGGRGAVGGRSSFRTSRGFSGRSTNPNFNPRGSLSTHQNLNPRGSLSPARNLNPQGALLRPRSGTAAIGGSSVLEGHRPRFSPPTDQQLQSIPRNELNSWAGVGLQQLETRLGTYGKAQVWRSYLELDKLKSAVDSAAKAPLDEVARTELESILQRFDQVATEKKYSRVAHLAGFNTVHSSLRVLVQGEESKSPSEVKPNIKPKG